MSNFSRTQSNDAPYIPFQDDDDDEDEDLEAIEAIENGLSESYSLQQTTSAGASDRQQEQRKTAANSGRRQPLFDALSSVSSSKRRYHQVPSEEAEEDQDIDEAPASLMVERRNSRKSKPRIGMDIKELTMWKWVNTENLDIFFGEVYAYYVGKGYYCILLDRILSLLTLAFVTGFSTFLIGCVDYSLIRKSNRLSDVVVPHCLSGLSGVTKFYLIMFSLFWIWRAVQLILDIPRLADIYNFYTYLLDIPDADIQTVSWQNVVNQIVKIRDNNPTTSRLVHHPTHTHQQQQRLDAHNIANRIMRQENYLIALINKDLLNLSIPLPFLRSKQMLTKTLEWNLSYCILNYVFNDEGQVSKRFVKDVQRRELIRGLRHRFIFAGCMNLVLAPFIVVYLILYFFFRYFDELYKNPSSAGSREWSPFARWKFREFNELPHLFQQRLKSSFKPAMEYLGQFPKEKTVLIAKFVTFITGSFAAILLLVTVIDPELILHDTGIFYMALFGGILQLSRGMIPDEHAVFDPEAILKEVVEFTHYLPDEWRANLHADEVRIEFSQMFEMKLRLYLEEILSVIFTPFVLWFSLPDCSESIIDFFREFTVHVDGVGFVCSFAEFDFKRHGNVKYGAPAEVNNEYYLSKEGKMEKSFLNFKANHPDWEPTDPAGSVFLSRLNEFNNQVNQNDRRSSVGGGSIRPSTIDSILRNNRRSNNVHFETKVHQHTYRPSAGATGAGSLGISSILKSGPSSHAPPTQEPRQHYRTNNHHSDPLDSSQENYDSELGDSYLLTGERGEGNELTESDHRPRQGSFLGLLTQLVENNTTR